MKKIAVITATRAEYGLLSPLIRQLMADSFFDCHLIVTGTHLSDEYGHTISNIEADGIPIHCTVPVLDPGHDPNRTIANCLTQFARIYEEERYDAVVLLGDRYELFGFAIPAVLQNIPIIHIHGGEKSEGAIDEKIRHSITKMAAIHFPSIKENADRIIQMGEAPDMVHAVGALGIDNALRLEPVPIDDLSGYLGLDLKKATAIVTYHPVTTDTVDEMRTQMHTVMSALADSGLQAVVTMPNSDQGGRELTEITREYVDRFSERMVFVRSLGQRRYLSCLRYAALVYGNSSSGIIETASFGVPTVNIGDRQKGRFAPANVIHCRCAADELREAIRQGLSGSFRKSLEGYVNPYGDGHTAERIRDILKRTDWDDERLVRKQFYDIPSAGGC